jgi:hypothetical protein
VRQAIRSISLILPLRRSALTVRPEATHRALMTLIQPRNTSFMGLNPASTEQQLQRCTR